MNGVDDGTDGSVEDDPELGASEHLRIGHIAASVARHDALRLVTGQFSGAVFCLGGRVYRATETIDHRQ